MCTVLKHAAVIQRTLIEQVYKLIANLIAQAKYVGSVAVVVRTVLFKAEKKAKNKKTKQSLQMSIALRQDFRGIKSFFFGSSLLN